MSPQVVSPRSLLALAAITALALATLSASAQTADSAATQLSPGVADVLKMSQAKVDDTTVISYIQTSDRGYGGLSPSEIVYLNEAGVSSGVVNAMLNKRKQLADANAQMAAQAAQTQAAAVAVAAMDATAATAAPVQCAPAYVPPPVVACSQPAAPVSTVSVIYVPHTPMFSGHAYSSGFGYRSLGFGSCGSVSVTYIGSSYARGGSRGSSCYTSFGRSGRSGFGRR